MHYEKVGDNEVLTFLGANGDKDAHERHPYHHIFLLCALSQLAWKIMTPACTKF